MNHLLTFFGSRHCTKHVCMQSIQVGDRVEILLYICFCLYYFIIQTSRTNLNSMIFNKFKSKNKSLTVQIFYNLLNHPTFHSEERLINLVRERKCFVGLPLLLVYTLCIYNITMHKCPPHSTVLAPALLCKWTSRDKLG